MHGVECGVREGEYSGKNKKRKKKKKKKKGGGGVWAFSHGEWE